MSLPSIPSLAGVWQREVNYEPIATGTVQDHAARDGSTVLWFQAPDGRYIDIRSIKDDDFAYRSFAGSIEVSAPGTGEAPNAAQSVFQSTWRRDMDSKPESCPEGIDSSVCRVAGPASAVTTPAVGTILLEEGSDFLEVWRRVAVWDDTTCTVVSKTNEKGAFTEMKITVEGLGEATLARNGDALLGSCDLKDATRKLSLQ